MSTGGAIEKMLVDAVARRLGVSGERLTPAGSLAPWLRDRLRTLSLSEPEELVARALADPVEWQRLLGVVLNGQTYFYRDAQQLEAVVDTVDDGARIWSAGCSTGEEAYSLAIMAAVKKRRARIVATDVNSASLTVARNARYFPWKLRHVPPDVAASFFRDDGEQFALSPELKRSVTFVEHNLALDNAPPLDGVSGAFDAVVCRNVLIYYDDADRAHILKQLIGALRIGGVLALGASDGVMDTLRGTEVVSLQGRLFLRRVDGATAGSAASGGMIGGMIGGASSGGTIGGAIGGATIGAPASATQMSKPPPSSAASVASSASPARPATPYSIVHIEQEARAALDAGDLKRARALVRDVVTRNPADVISLHSLAILDVMAHDFDGAERSLNAALALDPLLPETHVVFGVLHRKRQQWAEARAALQRALFLDPRSWIAAYLLWGTSLRLGRAAEAEQEGARALRLLRDVEVLAHSNAFSPFFAKLVPTAEECLKALS